jgi:predicted transcriptional regulator with HTH domain
MSTQLTIEFESKRKIDVVQTVEQFTKLKKSTKNQWSIYYKKCIQCGETETPHKSKGYCNTCYNIIQSQKRLDYPRQKKGFAEEYLTKDVLYLLYHVEKLSIDEIGRKAGTSPSNVICKMRRYGIQSRTKAEARILALDRGKITRDVVNKYDEIEIKKLNKIKYNTKFFDIWSDEMAYCLGLLYTDGCLSSTTNNIVFAQKDIELVEKFLNLFDCDAKILFRPERLTKSGKAGEMYVISLNGLDLYNQLIKLGLSPKKSLTIKFPAMPNKYVRHFIRGCWDGDGSVYFEKQSSHIKASFVSGSQEFLKTMIHHLRIEGLTEIKIYKHSHTEAYYFRYTSPNDIYKLFRYMYGDVPETQYLRRKYELFKQIILT